MSPAVQSCSILKHSEELAYVSAYRREINSHLSHIFLVSPYKLHLVSHLTACNIDAQIMINQESNLT
jgi:hypothetical protein